MSENARQFDADIAQCEQVERELRDVGSLRIQHREKVTLGGVVRSYRVARWRLAIVAFLVGIFVGTLYGYSLAVTPQKREADAAILQSFYNQTQQSEAHHEAR